ncbi:uncharacterized protein MYCGRDRAFT_88845 [Zymoseptoria tritici IPO323]|uniref:Uncharacterized protein n=1 Tax=Zymoseptoria tritici (strain CBS 115943 / IPO323) TaxID=336722 RepID=F9WW51_ZYMTI|nr:uncharacterized protein MYCGRDRAFT_88845 [Zymoseptoria tritici IPO323]EGP90950.1 hypothetical protein MYCGRDRAFT_88845 [Zymoseptoria tritici IPO323]
MAGQVVSILVLVAQPQPTVSRNLTRFRDFVFDEKWAQHGWYMNAWMDGLMKALLPIHKTLMNNTRLLAFDLRAIVLCPPTCPPMRLRSSAAQHPHRVAKLAL